MKKSHLEHTFESMKKFQKDCVTWSDGKKVRSILGKFGAVEHEKYANFILPRHPGEISFQETIKYSGSRVHFSTHAGNERK